MTDFLTTFQEKQAEMFQINEKHGFNDLDAEIEKMDVNYGVPKVLIQEIQRARSAQRLMLIVSELSEALEALRKGNTPDSHIPDFTIMEAELADAVIRIMNLSTSEGHRLGEAIVAKTAYNANRPYKHGGKKF